MEKVAKSHEILEHLKEDDEEEWTVLKTTKWDKMAVKGINVGGDIADIFIPGASLGMKLVATMFFQIAISNYSGKIRRIRIRVYTDLIGGFINYLTLSPNDPPLKNKRDQAYYDEGARKVQRMSDRVKFQYQIALLDYARTHLTSGPWGGTTYALHRLSTPNWHYPDDWEAKWSPAALTASLVTMLSFPRFLYE